MDKEDILSRMSVDVRCHIDNVMSMYEAPFARYIGLEIDSIESDRVECSLILTSELLNSMGRGHRGVIYSLMDHTFAIACNMFHPCTGQSSTISFYRPAEGRIRAVCIPINRSKSLEMFDVRAYAENGKLLASGTFTSFVLRRDPDV